MSDSYILQRGDEGARRLRLLARAAGPATAAFLDRMGLSVDRVGLGVDRIAHNGDTIAYGIASGGDSIAHGGDSIAHGGDSIAHGEDSIAQGGDSIAHGEDSIAHGGKRPQLYPARDRRMSALDVGCGIGGATALIARRAGRVVGVDVDAAFINLARSRNIPGAEFHCLDLSQLGSLEQTFDFVYARYLLSHLADPAAGLRAMMAVARSGAIIAVEDVDFPRHFHHPPCPAIERYIALYQAAARSRGANPCIGPHLVGLFQAAGLSEVRVFLSMTVHTRGLSKGVAEVTLRQITPALLNAGLATAGQIDDIASEIRRWRLDPATQLSIAPTFQVWGRV